MSCRNCEHWSNKNKGRVTFLDTDNTPIGTCWELSGRLIDPHRISIKNTGGVHSNRMKVAVMKGIKFVVPLYVRADFTCMYFSKFKTKA